MLKIAITVILLSLSFSPHAIDKILLAPQGGSHLSSKLEFTAPIQSEIETYLDLGNSLSKHALTIFSANKETFRVSLQLETSMSISSEGPHLDLTDWKHCTTDWVNAKAFSQSVFILPNFDTIDTACFPDVTQEEIKAEVFKLGGQRWADVLDEEGFPDWYSPASIALSMVRIKIEQQVGPSWQKVTIINVSIPMGC